MKKMIKDIVLSIDPSINYLGYAVQNTTKPKKKRLIDYGLINVGSKMKGTDYIIKARIVFNEIRDLVEDCDSEPLVVLEVPEFWGSAGLLARESGSVFKLTFLCGMICSLDNVITYTPSKWKGQMPKHVTANRLQEHYQKINFDTLDHNIADAIGIGHRHIYGEL